MSDNTSDNDDETSDGDDKRPSAVILDLTPRLAKKKAGDCRHDNCEVDMESTDLVCSDCDADLDPWWYLRRMVKEEADEIRRKQALVRQFEAWHADATARAARLTDEIAELLAVKNQLANTRVDGVRLGELVMKRRRRSTPGAKRA